MNPSRTNRGSTGMSIRDDAARNRFADFRRRAVLKLPFDIPFRKWLPLPLPLFTHQKRCMERASYFVRHERHLRLSAD